MKKLIKKLYSVGKTIEENKGLLVTGASVACSYGISLATGHGDIFGPVGHVLMGPFLKEIGDKIHSYISERKKGKLLYELGSILGGSSTFQVLKYFNCMPLPGVGNEFEISKVIYSVIGGLIAIGYERKKSNLTT